MKGGECAKGRGICIGGIVGGKDESGWTSSMKIIIISCLLLLDKFVIVDFDILDQRSGAKYASVRVEIEVKYSWKISYYNTIRG